MWSDESRKAALEARKRGAHSKTHEGKNGNRDVAKKAKKDASIAGGAIKGAGAGAIIGGVVGAAALHQFGGARIGAKLGALAGAKTGAIVGGIYNAGKKAVGNHAAIQNNAKVKAAIKAADRKKKK